MDSGQLFGLFRSDLGDIEDPPLWEDAEVWAYMDSAYKTFVRLTGGIPDIIEIDALAGEPSSKLEKKVLRFMSAHRMSDGFQIAIINEADLRGRTYGVRPGPLSSMILGLQRHTVHWSHVPVADEQVRLYVYRMPDVSITGKDQQFEGVDDHHHLHFLLGMKALAYRKQDTETINNTKALENEALYAAYCARVKGEYEREKHKTRVVAYGGL